MSQPTLADLKFYDLIYAATPYSKYHAGVEHAFQDAASIMGVLVKRGLKVYSPICHTHPIAIYGGIDPGLHDIWLPFDEALMDVSDALLIIKMQGWDASYGIEYEVDYFSEDGKPIFLLDPITLDVEAWQQDWGARMIPAASQMELAA